MNIYPDQYAFQQELEKAAAAKKLSVFEHDGSYFVMDETTGYITDSKSLSGAADFVNRFLTDRIRAGL